MICDLYKRDSSLLGVFGEGLRNRIVYGEVRRILAGRNVTSVIYRCFGVIKEKESIVNANTAGSTEKGQSTFYSRCLLG